MMRLFHPRRFVAVAILCLCASAGPEPENQATRPATAPTSQPAGTDPALDRIRDEGLNRSQATQTLGYLSDVIGPRLTGSPNLRRANEWTRQRLQAWGLADAHLEEWGPFGRGWELERFSAQVIEPQNVPLIAFPKAWSPGFEHRLVAPVFHLEVSSEADLDKYRGKLKGAIVLAGGIRELAARFDPLATRVSDPDLLQLANAEPGSSAPPGQARTSTASERQALFASTPVGRALMRGATSRPSTRPTSRPTTSPFGTVSVARLLEFLKEEEVALVVSPSLQGDGGTMFVAAAGVPGAEGRNGPRPWSNPPPQMSPQIVVATEQYNRMIRMIEAGEKLTMAVGLKVRYFDSDPRAYNTIAEIPGTDLKDQVVMVGAHMDSWHSGTGATDNGAGVAAAMEAVRIIRALDLHPRRTIRIGLWTGEEQGLLGSKAYVAKHFGSYEGGNGTTRRSSGGPTTQPSSSTRPARHLVRGPEYEQLSVYFNLDHGTGKIRGIYLQGNELARPIFRRWLAPFADLGAATITPVNTGGTDHVSFDAIGLPAFQFIQDPIEYWSRTHHSNEDVFDRIQADDLKQASTILATFVYRAATGDERFPRKTTEDEASTP